MMWFSRKFWFVCMKIFTWDFLSLIVFFFFLNSIYSALFILFNIVFSSSFGDRSVFKCRVERIADVVVTLLNTYMCVVVVKVSLTRLKMPHSKPNTYTNKLKNIRNVCPDCQLANHRVLSIFNCSSKEPRAVRLSRYLFSQNVLAFTIASNFWTVSKHIYLYIYTYLYTYTH